MALLLAVIEGAVLFTAVMLSVVISAPQAVRDLSDLGLIVLPALTVAACSIMTFYYHDLYDLRVTRNLAEFLVRLIQSLGVSFILMAAVYALVPTIAVSGRPFYSSMLITVMFVLPLRALTYAILRSRPFQERVLIVGTGVLARKLGEEIEAAPNSGFVLAGFVDEVDSNHSEPTGHHIVGPIDKLGWIIDTVRPERVVVAQSERRGRMPLRLLLDARMAGVRVEDGIEVYESLAGKVPIESLTPSALIFSAAFNKSRFQLGARRLVSLAVALLGLCLTTPLMVVLALAIKLDSAGPVFFIQHRAGARGRIFPLIKFRTMHPALEGQHSVFVRDDASRVTRVGRWLRRFRLDELPQFVNILKGHMDLIGPRPEMAANIATLTDRIPYYSLRFSVRPGVTGWAQIRHGYSVSEEDVMEKMRYDLYYIKHMSLWFDLRIIVDTAKIVLFGRGAR